MVRQVSQYIAGVMLLLGGVQSFAQSYDEQVEKYIADYKDWATEEMLRTGVPASITLAQGIIESNAGNSPLAKDANNHFGIKCHKEWTGEGYTYDDDMKDECFRKYSCALDSYKDHSDFLKNKSRYAVLFTYDPMDYKAWAKGLKACGYATNPQYASILIKCIEDYDLHQWDLKEEDRAAWFASLNKTVPEPSIKENGNPEVINNSLTSLNAAERVYLFNDIKCVTLHEDESPTDIATTYQIGMKRFMRYNEITDPAQLHAGDKIYLQPKRRHGDTLMHVVMEGENMSSISREHGIQLQALYEKNKMQSGMQARSRRNNQPERKSRQHALACGCTERREAGTGNKDRQNRGACNVYGFKR
jgi:DNA-binding phage protein